MKAKAAFLWLMPRNACVLLLRGYQRFISPLYGDVCRYYPSCSRYALEAVRHRGVIVGSALATWRILRCNPWSPGGVDDPSPGQRNELTVTPFGFVLAGDGEISTRHTEPTSKSCSSPVMAHSHRKA